MGNGAMAIGPKLPRPSSTLPSPTSRSTPISGHYGIVCHLPARLLRLDARELDHLGPFLDFFVEQRTKFCGAQRYRRAAKFSKAGLHPGISKNGVDLMIEFADDLCRGVPRRADASPKAGFIIRQ